jgi:uncharacterized protein DUF839
VRRTPRQALRYVVPALFTAGIAGGAVFANAILGPSSSEEPYLVRTMKGVTTTAILSAGDSVNDKPDGTPYRMVGIPDGLGAFDNDDGTFTVLMNHELGNTQGIVRAHGGKGAFVSRWIIDKETLEVLHGEDLIEEVGLWNGSAWVYVTNFAANRFCSADLPPVSAFYNADTGRGYNGRLFMNGEESGAEGGGFAHSMDGTSWRLPWLGKFSWENSLAHPATGDTTVVVGTDDSGEGQIYVYVGTKRSTGATPVELAGLMHGTLYGVKVTGFPFEIAATGIPSGTAFTGFSLGNVSTLTGAQIQSNSRAAGVTEFNRPEDGAWDPENPSDFYFVTTASFTGNCRLWRLRFNDPADPAAGGTIDQLLTGTEGHHMLDNLTISHRGQIFMQEDPGGNDHIAKIWRYDIDGDQLVEVAKHDPERFTPGEPGFLTNDEESSGIIDVSDILGEGKFLLDVQAHYGFGDTEIVQGGQLLLMHVPPGKKK